MRCFIVLIVLSLLIGCADSPAACYEHADEAAMATAARFEVFKVNGDATLSAITCALPQESGMEQALMERFLRENAAMLGGDVTVEVALEHDLALLDIGALPLQENADMEAALLDALTRTVTQLYGVERVQFRFDGENLAELPNGARCFGEFTMTYRPVSSAVLACPLHLITVPAALELPLWVVHRAAVTF